MDKVYHLNREARRNAGKGIKLPKKNDTLLSGKELREISKEMESLTKVDFSDMRFPIAVLYDRPVDYPDSIVARVFEMDNPTNIFVRYETVEDARNDALKAGFRNLIPKDEKDPPYIIESYI